MCVCVWILPSPRWFSPNNSETVKALTLALLEKFMENLESLTCPSLKISDHSFPGLKSLPLPPILPSGYPLFLKQIKKVTLSF